MLYCTVHALGEMAVLFPVAGSFSAYSTRFIDPAWGFAMGWNYALQWLVVLPLEIVAATFTIEFWTKNTKVVDNNVYVIGDSERVIVIDAPHDAAPILEAIAGRAVEAIVLTHGHDDHHSCVDELRAATGWDYGREKTCRTAQPSSQRAADHRLTAGEHRIIGRLHPPRTVSAERRISPARTPGRAARVEPAMDRGVVERSGPGLGRLGLGRTSGAAEPEEPRKHHGPS